MKIVSIVGARPQFIKAAVMRKLLDESGTQEILIHTGQHYDQGMSDVFFSELNIKPAEYRLSLTKRTHGAMTAEILERTEEILKTENPDVCLVYGDTNSTLAGALAAVKLHIPICHIEAGLRSFNKAMPEEINRVLTDHMSDLLLCSTYASIENLTREGITGKAHHVGDIMFDAVKTFLPTKDFNMEEHLSINLKDRPFCVLTIHRQENLSDPARLQKIVSFCESFSDRFHIIFLAHPNTKSILERLNVNISKFTPILPQPYLTTQKLLSECEFIMTDSGGMQKEAYFHGKRCITLRDETEWVETISHGWNRLWTTPDYLSEPSVISEYGDGNAAKKMLAILRDRYS